MYYNIFLKDYVHIHVCQAVGIFVCFLCVIKSNLGSLDIMRVVIEKYSLNTRASSTIIVPI